MSNRFAVLLQLVAAVTLFSTAATSQEGSAPVTVVERPASAAPVSQIIPQRADIDFRITVGDQSAGN